MQLACAALVQAAQTLLAKFHYFCGQSTNTSCYINVWFTRLIKRAPMMHETGNTDLPRGHRGHVDVVITYYFKRYGKSTV